MAAMENDFENTTISLYGTVPDSIVDGPGLRYAVFVQGCSHGCPGCHNPESQPAEGGTETTLAALLADIRANGLAHDVTLSGGEPFFQEAFALKLLRLAREAQVHTCVETCGHFELEPVLDPFCALIDHIFWDVKFLDAEKHREYCGVDNELILHNLKCAAQRRKDIVVRTVIMRGISDSEEHVRPIAEFVRSLGLENPPVLLAFHPFGSSKGEAVGLDKTYMGKEYIPEERTLAHLREIVRQ